MVWMISPPRAVEASSKALILGYIAASKSFTTLGVKVDDDADETWPVGAVEPAPLP